MEDLLHRTGLEDRFRLKEVTFVDVIEMISNYLEYENELCASLITELSFF